MKTQKTQQEDNHIQIDKAMYEIERLAIRNNTFCEFDWDGLDVDPIHSLDETVNDLLNAKEREVIHRRFYLKETLKSVGLAIRVNPERVRQIEAKALRKLRMAAKILAPAAECIGINLDLDIEPSPVDYYPRPEYEIGRNQEKEAQRAVFENMLQGLSPNSHKLLFPELYANA